MDVEALLEACRARLGADAPAPASAGELREAERRLGFPLPPLLRRLYTEVANGTWGPGHGANGLITGARVDLDDGLVDADLTMRSAGADADDDTWPGWPGGLVAVCHWGCAIWSCVDCGTDDGRVIRFDPNPFGPETGSWRGAWTLERPTLASFLTDWLEDRLPFEPAGPQVVCPTPPRFTASWHV